MEKILKKECFSASQLNLPKHPTAMEDHRSVVAKGGHWIFIPGILVYEAEYGRINPNLPYYQSRAVLQTRYVHELHKTCLESVGSSLDGIVQITDYVKSDLLFSGSTQRTMQDVVDERKMIFKPQRPAIGSQIIRDLYVKDSLLESEVIAFTNDVKKEIIQIDPGKIPQPMGAESTAVRAGSWIFISALGSNDKNGPVALEVKRDSNFWFGSDAKLQTHYILRKLKVLLEAAGSSLEDVCQTTVSITDPRDIYCMDEVWKQYFPDNPPARTILPVDGLASPEWKIQVDAIAIASGGEIKKETVYANNVPKPHTHEPHAIKAGPMIFTSGLMATDKNGLAKEVRPDPDYADPIGVVRKQAEYIYKCMAAIFEAAGSSIHNVARDRSFYAGDIHEYVFPYMAKRAEVIKLAPVATGIEIRGPLPVPGCIILVDAIGFVTEKDPGTL